MHNLGALTSVPGAIIEKLVKDSINKPSEVRDTINVFQKSPTEYRPPHAQEKYIFCSRKVSERTPADMPMPYQMTVQSRLAPCTTANVCSSKAFQPLKLSVVQ